MNYIYPDNDDVCNKLFATHYGYQLWYEEEHLLLDKLKCYLLREAKSNLMIDAGCGEGRLLPFFAPLFNRIICVEPDIKRLEVANSLACTLSNIKFEFHCGNIPDIQLLCKADFIFCSHVLQHMPTALVKPFINWLANHLNQGGCVWLAFEKSTSSHSRFCISQSNGNSMFVSEERYNRATMEKEVLPSHQIPVQLVETYLEQNGLFILKEYPYHLGAKFPLPIFRIFVEILKRQTFLTRRIGADHVMLAIKKPEVLGSNLSEME
ncbi:MAG: class I SAM-dependent methyltransferase [Ktedonobacteraceae bacterium]